MLKFSRRKLMQWAAGSAAGSVFLGGLLGRRASAQSVPFVDLALAGVVPGVTPNGTGLWLLDQMGQIHTLGNAPPLLDETLTTRRRPSPFVAMVSMPNGGLAALTMDGHIRTFGFTSKAFDLSFDQVHIIPCVKIARNTSGEGLWGIDLMGNVHTYGDADSLGDGTVDPCYSPSPYVGLVPTPTGNGLYALTQNGYLRTFGDARVLGDGAMEPCFIPSPFVALAITPTGAGLWALDLLGKVRTLGSATPLGDGAIIPCLTPTPFVAMVPTPSGLGLYALNMSGQLQTFGDAQNFTPIIR